MIARSRRLLGKPVLFPIGFDRNGINVEIYVERNSNVRMRDTPREQFIELCSSALDKLESQMTEIMMTVGLSGDYDQRYHTDEESYRKFTQSTFIELWRRGLVYETTRPNNY
jgi:valyl-tRNA synthetase